MWNLFKNVYFNISISLRQEKRLPTVLCNLEWTLKKKKNIGYMHKHSEAFAAQWDMGFGAFSHRLSWALIPLRLMAVLEPIIAHFGQKDTLHSGLPTCQSQCRRRISRAATGSVTVERMKFGQFEVQHSVKMITYHNSCQIIWELISCASACWTRCFLALS